VSNFFLSDCPDNLGRNRHNRDGFPRQCKELDFLPSPIDMYHHNPTHVSGLQPFVRLAFRQYDGIKFLNHC
jgi:hypothetical protein